MSPNDRVRQQQQQVREADQALARRLAARYGTSWQRIRVQLDALAREVQAARARGELVDEAWLRRRGVLERFGSQARTEIRVFLDFARRHVDDAILARAAQGTADANELLRSSLPPGVTPVQPLPVAETAQMIAATRPGAPLASLLEPLGQDAAQRAVRTLIRGVAEGLGPRETARALAADLGGNLVRALRIARTETLGAYRRATLARYQANRQYLDGWIWVARLDATVCPVCVAMHGTVHPLDEPFATHPNCRCSPVPLTKAWAELGFPGVRESRFTTETGGEWFARQPRDRQRLLLGPGKLDLYEQGGLPLADLVVDTQHPLWGPGRRERALRDLPLVNT